MNLGFKIRFFMVCLALLALQPIQAEQLRLTAFTSDGCSLFVDGTPRQADLWLHCCIAHDRAYWMGGSRDRKKAVDEAFRQCVAETGQASLAEKMKKAVEFGGDPNFPTPFRWGFGWSSRRGFAPLSPAERALVLQAIEKEIADLQVIKQDL